MTELAQFWTALAAFLLSHAGLAAPPVRARLIAALGRRVYLALFSALSLALLGWTIAAAAAIPADVLWLLPYWNWWVPNLAMPIACILLVAGMTTPNPLSIAAPGQPFDPGRPGLIVAVTRHPVLWAFALWALSHLPPNGEWPLVLLFGSLAAFAFAGMPMVDAKRRRKWGAETWHHMAQGTSILPFAALLSGRSHALIHHADALRIIGGLLLWGILFWLHGPVIGIRPVPPLP